jgi:hypothetical protein
VQGNEIMMLPRMDESYDLGENPILAISVDTELRVLEVSVIVPHRSPFSKA